VNYGLAYAIGFHPWEELADHPPFADRLLELGSRTSARATARRGVAALLAAPLVAPA